MRIFPLILLTSLSLSLVACGEDEPAPSNNDMSTAADMAADQPNTPDLPNTPDQSTAPDLADPPDMVDVSDQTPCDRDATAAAQVAVNDQVNDGDVTASEEDGVWTATIDASSGGPPQAPMRSYVYLNLATAQKVAISDRDAAQNTDWNIAFKRSEIRINGADSGPGAMIMARVEGTTWETARPPASDSPDWRSDSFVTDSCELITYGRGSLQTAFADWYDYNPMQMSVTVPDGVIFFLYNSTARAAVKLQITGWENGVYSLRWAPLSR
jgi:hypothetical protein